MYCYSCGSPLEEGTTICYICKNEAVPHTHLRFRVIPNGFTPSGTIEINLYNDYANETINFSTNQHAHIRLPIGVYSMTIKTPDGSIFENTIYILGDPFFNFTFDSISKTWVLSLDRMYRL